MHSMEVVYLTRKSDFDIKELTLISIGVATIIAGGIGIFQLSLIFPLPGVKYMLLSPYLSMVIFILLTKVNSKFALLKIGCTFGFIMMMMNLYMGFTIIITALASQLSIVHINNSKKAFYGAVLFSTYAGVIALTISKYMIGGVFKEISIIWFIITGLICFVFGILGTILAKKVMRHKSFYSYEKI